MRRTADIAAFRPVTASRSRKAVPGPMEVAASFIEQLVNRQVGRLVDEVDRLSYGDTR